MVEFKISKTYLLEKIMLILYYLNLYYNWVLNQITNLLNIYYYNSKDILFIKDFNIIQHNNHNDFKFNFDKIPKADYCVITYQHKDDINKTINYYTRVTDNYNFLHNPNKNICSFTFILVTLESKDKKYDITKYIKNDYHNYYLEDAIMFDKNFNNWLCYNFLKEKLDNIKITILDNNVNQISLSDNQYIKLGLNNYHICESS